MGWTKKQADGATPAAEAEQSILPFVRASQASLGGSRSLLDLSGEGEAVLRFLTQMNQIGQTPHAVAGGLCISVERSISTRIAGWARGKADLLYVADAFAVRRKVNRLLGAFVGRRRPTGKMLCDSP